MGCSFSQWALEKTGEIDKKTMCSLPNRQTIQEKVKKWKYDATEPRKLSFYGWRGTVQFAIKSLKKAEKMRKYMVLGRTSQFIH